MKKTFHSFRMVAMAEGVSFLVLLLIAMPLKYFAGFPLAVTIIGALHGILFIAFMIMAWEVKNGLHKNFKWFFLCFIAAILPFGTFILDKNLKKEQIR